MTKKILAAVFLVTVCISGNKTLQAQDAVVQEGELLHQEEPPTVVVYEMSHEGSNAVQLSAFLREVGQHFPPVVVQPG